MSHVILFVNFLFSLYHLSFLLSLSPFSIFLSLVLLSRFLHHRDWGRDTLWRWGSSITGSSLLPQTAPIPFCIDISLQDPQFTYHGPPVLMGTTRSNLHGLRGSRVWKRGVTHQNHRAWLLPPQLKLEQILELLGVAHHPCLPPTAAGLFVVHMRRLVFATWHKPRCIWKEGSELRKHLHKIGL